MHAAILCLLLLYPAPRPEPTIVGTFQVKWGEGRGEMTFHDNGVWTSVSWGSGWWWEDDGLVWMGQGERCWAMRIDWLTRTARGWQIDLFGAHCSVDVLLRRVR